MTSIEKLKMLIEKHDGVITTKLAGENNTHREYLSQLVRLGDIERVGHGIYVTPDVWEDGLMINQLRRSRIIYSHETALYLHDLTDRDPVNMLLLYLMGLIQQDLKMKD